MKRKYKLNYIITSHGSDVLGYNKRFAKLYPFLIKPWKKYIKEAKVVTTPSQFLQDEIKKITTDGNFVVIPNGIDKDKFKPLKKGKRILVVARLFINKGVQDILDALKNIELGEWRVDIVGDGPYKEFLINKTKENKLDDKVTFHGWIDNKSDKMKELYGKAKVFISASYFESFGLTALEAMQSGCYCLLSDIPGYKQLDLPEECYFKVGDTNSIKGAISNFIQKSETTKNIIFNKKYEWDNIIKEFVNILDK